MNVAPKNDMPSSVAPQSFMAHAMVFSASHPFSSTQLPPTDRTAGTTRSVSVALNAAKSFGRLELPKARHPGHSAPK